MRLTSSASASGPTIAWIRMPAGWMRLSKSACATTRKRFLSRIAGEAARVSQIGVSATDESARVLHFGVQPVEHHPQPHDHGEDEQAPFRAYRATRKPVRTVER